MYFDTAEQFIFQSFDDIVMGKEISHGLMPQVISLKLSMIAAAPLERMVSLACSSSVALLLDAKTNAL